VKDGKIELQGNHKKQVKPILVKLGFAEESITD
jgi:translation initiation factor 1 (eIF-1/SUI1)